MTHPQTTTGWFKSLERRERKNLLAFLHIIRRSSEKDLSKYTPTELFDTLIFCLENDHKE